jgi:hypothetical protein
MSEPLISRLEKLAQEVDLDIVHLWDEFVAFIKSKIEHKKVAPPAPVAGSATTPVIAPSEPPAGV